MNFAWQSTYLPPSQSVSQSSHDQPVQMLSITENTILFVLLLSSSGCLQQKPVSIPSFAGPQDFAAAAFQNPEDHNQRWL